MTQHRPGRESKQAIHPALVRMEAAIQHGRTPAFTRALEELLADRSGAHGLWQHRALGLILRSSRSEGAEIFLKQLLGCPRPPRPSSKENFAGLALVRDQTWALPLLADHGFQLRDAAIEGASPFDAMGRSMAQGRWPVPERIAPGFLASKRGQQCLISSLGMEAFCSHHYTQGRGFFHPDQAARFIQLAQQCLPDASDRQGLAQAIGKAIAHAARGANWKAMDPHGTWKDGMSALVEAGLLDLPTLHECLVREGEQGWKLRDFLELALARSLELRMEQHTPVARTTAPRAARL